MMHKNIPSRFFFCGTLGWCLEIIFTSLHCLKENNRKMIGSTSIWMFPIYGMASFFTPLCRRLRLKGVWHRGGVYTLLIFFCELVSGSLLSRINACPWDYSHAKWNFRGLIRLDYAPLWFGVGLLYEKLLTANSNGK